MAKTTKLSDLPNPEKLPDWLPNHFREQYDRALFGLLGQGYSIEQITTFIQWFRERRIKGIRRGIRGDLSSNADPNLKDKIIPILAHREVREIVQLLDLLSLGRDAALRSILGHRAGAVDRFDGAMKGFRDANKDRKNEAADRHQQILTLANAVRLAHPDWSNNRVAEELLKKHAERISFKLGYLRKLLPRLDITKK